MLELGEAEHELHERIGEHAAASGVDLLVTVGPLARSIAQGYGGDARSVPDAAAAAELVPGLLKPGDVVLVKGSRGVGLEHVCRTLSPGDSAS
jgi:UDP-N-acetylmuramyl pentapeptide synthase